MSNDIFSSIIINKKVIKNRIVRSATCEHNATKLGHITVGIVNMYQELAKQDIGIVITGAAAIDKKDMSIEGMISIASDEYINDFIPITDYFHSRGNPILMQLVYGGMQTHKSEYRTGCVWAPSTMVHPVTKIQGREMSSAEIQSCIKLFGNAAYRAYVAGFDGIQIHAAHHYLLSQFMSPLFNKRNDEYGYGTEGRIKIILEVIHGIRKRVGKDFIISIKINYCDFGFSACNKQELLYICKQLEQEGIDAIEVSSVITKLSMDLSEPDYYQNLVEISEKIDIPIIYSGGITSRSQAEVIIREGKINMVAMCRQFLYDINALDKWRHEPELASACRHCNQCKNVGVCIQHTCCLAH